MKRRWDPATGIRRFWRPSDALQALAEATQHDRDAVALLTTTNSKLASDVALLNIKIAELTAENAGLKATVKLLTSGTVTTTRDKPPRTRTRRHPENTYCWTHGFDVAPTHTSATCKAKKEGHQVDATFNNNLGGSQRNKHLVQ